jgi:DNA-binding phage protein
MDDADEMFEDVIGAIRSSPMSTFALAKASGVHPNTLDAWVSRKVNCPSLRTLVKVAATLGMTVELRNGRVRAKVYKEPPPRPKSRTALWRLQ